MPVAEKPSTPNTATVAEVQIASATPRVGSLIVVDVDKRYSKKQIKKLREGRGKLMARVSELIEEMAAENALPPNAQPIVVIVREKRDRGLELFE